MIGEVLTFVDPQIAFSSQFFILVKVLSDYYRMWLLVRAPFLSKTIWTEKCNLTALLYSLPG